VQPHKRCNSSAVPPRCALHCPGRWRPPRTRYLDKISPVMLQVAINTDPTSVPRAITVGTPRLGGQRRQPR
jgi:hypothetical protein